MLKPSLTVRVGKGALFVGAAVAIVVCAQVATAQTIDLDVQATRGNRVVDVTWSQSAEANDELFGGYNVWRSIVPDPAGFLLLRRFDRRYPVMWTYCGATPFPTCDSPDASELRSFSDADSIVTLRKVAIGALGDSVIVREYVGIPPHNGFPYFYATTWFSECLNALNDTVRVEMPQPEIFQFMQGGETLYGFIGDEGDTLEVRMTPCRRIDVETNNATGDPVTVFQGTAESGDALRHFAIEATRLDSPIFPSTTPNADLQGVQVIPNPYELNAFWDLAGERKVQFINLTDQAVVRIYTLSGDLVRRIDHPASGSAPDQGSVDWDLKNASGRDVKPGLYLWHVETPGRVVTATGKLAIIY